MIRYLRQQRGCNILYILVLSYFIKPQTANPTTVVVHQLMHTFPQALMTLHVHSCLSERPTSFATSCVTHLPRETHWYIFNGLAQMIQFLTQFFHLKQHITNNKQGQGKDYYIFLHMNLPKPFQQDLDSPLVFSVLKALGLNEHLQLTTLTVGTMSLLQ